MKTSGLNRLWPVALLLLRGLVVHGQQVLFTQASDPAGLVNQSAYHAVGVEVSTVTAPMESGANRFTHWTVNGVRDNDFLGCALNPVRIRLDGDTTAVAHYTNGAADADADGVGDWFEWYHLGALAGDGASDGDGDGVGLREECRRDLQPLIHDRLTVGGVSRRLVSPIRVKITAVEYAFVSEPVGLVDQRGLIETGTVVQTPNLQGENGTNVFGYWTVEGVRQADGMGRALSRLTFVMTNDVTAVAHYFGKTVDTESDGLPDWWEWLNVGSLAQDGATDGDGDGFGLAEEYRRDFEPLLRDRLTAGGVSRRQTAPIRVRITAREYTFTSDPAGLLYQNGLVEAGAVIQTPNLQGENGTNLFAYWTVEGVRQTDRLGRALSRLTFTVTNDILAVARYVGKTVDTDADGLPDGWEWLQFGDLTRSEADDGDGDGVALRDEYRRDFEPLIADRFTTGGVSRRRSHACFYVRPTPRLTVVSAYGGASPPVGTHLLDWETELSCRVTNSPITVGLEQVACRGWTGTGSVPESGAATHTGPFVLRGDSRVTWHWGTNYWVDVGASVGGGVDQADQWVESGSNLTVTATAADGYHFTGWNGDASGMDNPLTLAVNTSLTVAAHFALNVITVLTDRTSLTVPEGGTNAFRLKLSAQPTGETVVAVARLSGDADLTVSGGSLLTFSPVNWHAYQAVTLSAAEDDGDNADGTAVITCGGDGLTAATVEASEADDDYVLTVTSPYGTVVVEPDAPYYDNGTEVTVWAIPDASYCFLGWTGDLSGTNNPASVILDADKGVTADYGPTAPVVLPPSRIGAKRFTARWQWVEGGAPEGELDVAANAAFTSSVPGYAARYVVNDTECLVTNLLVNRDYWYRVRRLMPDGATVGAWSSPMKAHTGKEMPVLTRLLSEGPVSKGIVQEFALTDLVTGTGKLRVKSSNTNAVTATVDAGVLRLRYLWKGTNAARVTLTFKHPEMGYKVSYATPLSRAGGGVAVVGTSGLTNAGARVAQEVTLENRTGATVYGVRVRALGLDPPAWLINRTGRDPVSGAPIRELPCVWPAGARMVVRLVYANDYKKQARTRPVQYGAWAILTPVGAARPVTAEMAIQRQDRYDGLWLLGLPANRNRLYAVFHSDDAGLTWVPDVPAVRAAGNFLMWLDPDEAAPTGRVYRVLDAGR